MIKKLYTLLHLFILICIICILKYTKSQNIHFEMPILNKSDINNIKMDIMKICDRKNVICKVNYTNVCAVRILENKNQYRDFQNSCYLFLSNVCEYSKHEFYIIQSGTCEVYLNSRRTTSRNQTRTEDKIDVLTQTRLNYSDSENKTYLREDTLTTLYEIDSAFDYHVCPLSCPDVYSPVCVSVNRGFGKYFKFYTFVNHCSGDLYYCKHWREFSPPPDEDEMVNSSPLGWSYCGASRYLQFARFSEVVSAMGHYGWLAGDYRYSHIVEPYQRVPGYG